MDNQKSNIVGQINSGFINIESVSDFEELLNDFPEDPALHKAYGNLLMKKEAGKTVMHRATYPVREAPHYGIEGGWEVDGDLAAWTALWRRFGNAWDLCSVRRYPSSIQPA